MNQIAINLIVTVFGLIASILTAAILWLVEVHLGFAFYSLMIWFIFPVGAVLSGFVVAGGYYLGAILFSYKPTKLFLLNMVLVSIGTFFGIYWISYVSLKIAGKPVSDFIPFSQYMDTVLQHQTIAFPVHGTEIATLEEIGSIGYATAVLQILGFTIGSIFVYFYLADLPFCDKCHKYFKAKSKQIRYSADPDSFLEMIKNIVLYFNNNQLQEAIEMHRKYGDAKNPKGGYLNSSLELKRCPECKEYWLKYSAKKLTDNDWENIKEFQFTRLHKGDLRL